MSLSLSYHLTAKSVQGELLILLEPGALPGTHQVSKPILYVEYNTRQLNLRHTVL